MEPDIQIKKIYQQPIDKVWKRLTTQKALSTWLMFTEDFQLKVGHTFHFKDKPFLGFDGVVKCEILDIDPPISLVYTWDSNRLKSPTLVTWYLREVPGGTSVQLKHTGFKGFRSKVATFFLKRRWNKLMIKMMD